MPVPPFQLELPFQREPDDFRSQIRDSVINQLLEKVAEGNYRTYLKKVSLLRVRGFGEAAITFDFPVTALIGPNGGGKTTILGAAACAYKSVSPRQFYAKSGRFDDSMQNWSIEYNLIDRNVARTDEVRRTASFLNSRWRRDALDREVLVFGVSRTVPANERTELRRCASSTFSVPAERIEDLEDPVKESVEKILGKSIARFKRIKVDRGGKVTLLSGSTEDGTSYSEFHFGAGESSVIRMVATIESSADHALVLIEEIENGLHPLATIRMVEYLIDAAHRKRIQSIFTTHSNDALLALPSKAIWVATGERVHQGKLDIRSLRAMTGRIDARLAIFVEDAFAKLMVESALRNYRDVALDHIRLYAMEGDGTAVEVHLGHNRNPSIRFPSLCFIDGDSRQRASDENRIMRLPGESPETYTFDKVLEAYDEWGGKLSVALHQRFEKSEEVKVALTEIRRTTRDPHVLYSRIGERLGLLPQGIVSGAFTSIWAQAYPEEISALLDPISEWLPTEAVSEETHIDQ